MTVEQLHLITVPPTRLKPRQQAVLDALTKAGPDGIDADQAGALAHGLKDNEWAHGPDDRCKFCGQDGLQILHALRDKGLARYRRGRNGQPGYWQVAGADRSDVYPPGMLRPDQPIGF